MSKRSQVFALLERYKQGFDDYDDIKIRDCFVWPCTVWTHAGAVSIHEPPVTTAPMRTLKSCDRSVNWERFYTGPVHQGLKGIRDKCSSASLVSVEGG